MNSIQVFGNLGSVALLTVTPTGKRVAKVSIASSRGRKSDKADWIRIEAWDGLADQLASFPKGSFVKVTGNLKTESYEKDGVKRTSSTVTVRALELVPRKEKVPA